MTQDFTRAIFLALAAIPATACAIRLLIFLGLDTFDAVTLTLGLWMAFFGLYLVRHFLVEE